jgi:hypothetical protein
MMKTAKVLFALAISACTAVTAAACSSSQNPDAGIPGAASASGSGSGGPPRGGSPPSSGSRGASGVSFACGPNNACNAPLNFCCIGVLEGGTGSAVNDAATNARDGALPADAIAEAANDSGEAGASQGSGVDANANGVTDAATQGEAGHTADAAGGGGASSQSAGGFEYHCSSGPDTCPMGTSVIFACAGVQSCSSGQVCCAEFGDGGFVAKCEPAPCSSGVTLCVSPSDCRSGEACVPASDYAGAYNTCVPPDGGLNDGAQHPDSSHGGDGSPTQRGPGDGGAAD